jgi:hypothetical protein
MTPRIVDEQASHRPRGEREELSAVAPLALPFLRQLQVRLVHERRRRQRVIGAFTGQPPVGYSS